ncbi:MAG: hypothetical protein IJR45_00015 [Firmicutes bacterium]|nr:hypothetical protein [Bacillota bacterium]
MKNIIKKSIIPIIFLIVIIALCSVYTSHKKQEYGNTVKGELTLRYYNTYFPVPRWFWGCIDPHRTYFKINVKNDWNNDKLLFYGAGIDLVDGAPELVHNNTLKITDLEYFLIMDIARNTVQKHDELKHIEDNETAVYYDYSYGNAETKEDLVHFEELKANGIEPLSKKVGLNFGQSFLLCFVTELSVYLRRGYLFMLPIYAAWIIAFCIISKSFFGEKYGFKNSVKTVWSKTRKQRKFIAFTVLTMLVLDILMLIIPGLTSICYEIEEAAVHSAVKLFVENYPTLIYKVHLNIFVFVAFLTAQSIIYKKTTGAKPLKRSFIAPSLTLFVMQFVFFSNMLGLHYIRYDYAPFQDEPIFRLLRDYMGFFEPMTVHSKVVVFTVWFSISLFVFYMFMRKAYKNNYIRLAWSAAFACCNAFMCCLSCYIMNFWFLLEY